MYWPDVIDLKQFYSTALGQQACTLISRAIHARWPSATGDTMLGLGFSTPYLGYYIKQGAQVAACMPLGQGALYWPHAHPNLTLLAEESRLPFADNILNRVLLVHMVENSTQLAHMLQEIWRVLTPGGRLLAVVPNRIGIWSRSGSPFGYGQPYSTSQLKHLLLEHRLTPTYANTALYMPPSSMRLVLRSADVIERAGSVICSGLGGVLLMEAEKQIYAVTRELTASAKRQAIYTPVAKPAGV